MHVKLRKKINESYITPVAERTDVENIIEKLKILYAEEILAWYQYYIVTKFLTGQERPSVAKEFETIAKDELEDHADKLLKRISELGGDITTINDIDNLKVLSKCQYFPPMKTYHTITQLEENIQSELCAIKHYIELADMTKDKDYTTYCMAVEILADEEEHLRELQDLHCDITGEEFMPENFKKHNDEYVEQDIEVINQYVDDDGNEWTQTPELGELYVLRMK